MPGGDEGTSSISRGNIKGAWMREGGSGEAGYPTKEASRMKNDGGEEAQRGGSVEPVNLPVSPHL